MTPLKADEIRKMERAGRLGADLLTYLGKMVRPGIATDEIDMASRDWVASHECTSASLGYHGFPKAICVSVNDCICHGVPGAQILKDGDIVNIDVTVIKDGFHGDTSAMFFVGEVSNSAKMLCEAAEKAMYKGIDEVRPNGTTGDIGFAVQKYVTQRGYHPVKDIGGHGIGRKFHDEPFVPSYGKRGRGDVLVPWICITVEPMINETSVPIKEYSIPNSAIKYYLTGDGTLSAQYEHTVLVTDSGVQILTLRDI